MLRGDLEFDSDQESGSENASMQKPARQRRVTFLGDQNICLGRQNWVARVPSQTESAESPLAKIIGKWSAAPGCADL
jgi:hypothetical protein